MAECQEHRSALQHVSLVFAILRAHISLMSKRPDSAALPDFEDPAYQLPATVAQNRTRVKKGFWRKLLRVAGRVPFAEEAAAAYYCALDPKTPARVRATLLAALAYFVTPADFIPDVIAAFGFTDDATVLMMALSVVSGHLTEKHRAAARMALGKTPPQAPQENPENQPR
jgi:uncharacterized membrane protein YkvA (DUF1232 family)